MKRARAVLAAGLVLVSAACASNPKPRTRPDLVTPSVGTTVEGTASWYGPGYDGKKTSCGERFQFSGNCVVVLFIYLFPIHMGRLFYVSKGVAKAIGLIGPGTGRVRLEVVD